jgi:hypothetical protein
VNRCAKEFGRRISSISIHHNFSDSNCIAGRYSQTNSTSNIPDPFLIPQIQQYKNNEVTLPDNSRPSPSLPSGCKKYMPVLTERSRVALLLRCNHQFFLKIGVDKSLAT